MHFLLELCSKWALYLCCSLFMAINFHLCAGSPLIPGSVAIPIGPPILVSPVPGPANPDPVLQNLVTVMDNHYIQPYYPGDTPYPSNYLGKLYFQANTYSGQIMAINPTDNRFMCANIGQNYTWDFTRTFSQVSEVKTNTLATSTDGGLTWSYGPPVEQIIPLGGTHGQYINASYGPGLSLSYDKTGKLYSFGQGFDDTRPNFDNDVPTTGWLFTTSDDNGATWSPLQVIARQNPNWTFLQPLSPYNQGWQFREFYMRVNPAETDFIPACTAYTIYGFQRFAVIYYFASYDGGKTFSTPTLAYNIWNDPVWQAKYFNPSLVTLENYAQFGGFALPRTVPISYNDDILVMGVERQYPKLGATSFSGTSFNTTFDSGLIRSMDRGKTWSNVAYCAEPILPSFGTTDPGFVNPFANGRQGVAIAFGKDPFIISPLTGRIYQAMQAANPKYNLYPNFPYCTYITACSTSDLGDTWTPWVQVNATPTNLTPITKQQAFGLAGTITLDGSVVFAYCDFRNWTGRVGENVLTTPLQTDVWLAVYKETDDPRGGSTGIGLDFVEELRVTAQSFNARVFSQSTLAFMGDNTPYYMGMGEGMTMLVNSANVLYLMYSTNNENNLAKITRGYKGLYIDTNNRSNIYLQRYQFPLPSNQ